jgi:hypothetical protein
MQSREEHRKYMRQYRIDTGREHDIQWRKDHVEKRKNYMKQYRMDHADEIQKYKRDHVQEKRKWDEQYRREQAKEFRKWKEFAGPCRKCGNSDPRVLEFHHLDPKKKKFCICVGAWYRRSLIELIEELAKCEVLCANCHKIEEFENGAWK